MSGNWVARSITSTLAAAADMGCVQRPRPQAGAQRLRGAQERVIPTRTRGRHSTTPARWQRRAEARGRGPAVCAPASPGGAARPWCCVLALHSKAAAAGPSALPPASTRRRPAQSMASAALRTAAANAAIPPRAARASRGALIADPARSFRTAGRACCRAMDGRPPSRRIARPSPPRGRRSACAASRRASWNSL